jgi:hypothetical protein
MMMETGRKAELEPADAKQEYRRRRAQGGRANQTLDARKNRVASDRVRDRRVSFGDEADTERWKAEEFQGVLNFVNPR